MFKNYLVTSWRNLLKSKGFSFLNIAGLAVGLAVCLLILLYVRAETSYDAFHEHANRVYRIQTTWRCGTLRSRVSRTHWPHSSRRLARQEGQNPRVLQENVNSCSLWQSGQRIRARHIGKADSRSVPKIP